jgi:dTDP-4-dehydrorhamnose 3,5-epimerase
VKRIETGLDGVCLLEAKVFGDRRGYFMETYNAQTFAGIGIDCRFVQDNQSRSTRGALRGLHYQLGRPQAKLARVLSGEVFDVVVDVRQGSPTFGRWISAILSGENQRALFIPVGFAHGFYVLSDTAEFIYKCSDFYAPAEERGVIWNDPDLAIAWPLIDPNPIMSEKDLRYGTLRTRPLADLPVHRAATQQRVDV